MMKFSRPFLAGLVAGVGLGLMIGAALVELEWLASTRKAWVSLVGAILFGVGMLLRKKGA